MSNVAANPPTDAQPALDDGRSEKERLWDEIEAEEAGAAATDPDDPSIPDLESPSESALPDERLEAPSNGNPSEDPTAQLDRLRHQFESEKGRTTALSTKAAELLRENQRLNAQLNELKAAKQSPENAEKLKKSREEYGDVVGPIIDHVQIQDKQIDQLTVATQATLDQNQTQLKDLIAEQTSLFKREHPDEHTVIAQNRGVFDQWLDDQPAALRKAFKNNEKAIVNGAEAAMLVAAFKAALPTLTAGNAPAPNSNATLQARREKQLAGSRSDKPLTSNAVHPAPSKDMNDRQAHWDYFDSLDAKKAAAARR